MKTWQLFVRRPIVHRIALGGAGVLILSNVAVRPAHSQFGIDIAAILAGLKEINSTLSSAVASPLKTINQVEQQEQQLQQNVLYPISATMCESNSGKLNQILAGSIGRRWPIPLFEESPITLQSGRTRPE